MELTTITRKQAGRIYAAVRNNELDMDKGMVARMYDEADWGAPRGLGGRDRKAEVSRLIEALNEGNEREAQMYAEALWGDEDEAEAIAEELEAADKAKAEREAEANADKARAAKADAMLAKIGELNGKNLAGVETLGVEKAEAIIANWAKMMAHRPGDWAQVEAAGEAAVKALEAETEQVDETGNVEVAAPTAAQVFAPIAALAADEAEAARIAERLDAADKLVTAESLSDYRARMAYCAAHGEPFVGTTWAMPNPADVMDRFRRIWRDAHPGKCGCGVHARAKGRHARRCPALLAETTEASA